MKAKVFESPSASKLEATLNQWLSDYPNIQIQSVTQSEAVAATNLNWNITLTVIYSETDQVTSAINVGLVESMVPEKRQ